jgi:hypothetical protein
MTSAISRFVPTPRLREVDRIAVAASPAEAWKAVRELDLYDLRTVRALFTARALPARAGAWLRGEHPAPEPRTARLDEIVGPGTGFHLLAEVPGAEFVAGAIGKFWEATIPFAEVAPERFAAFDTTGFGKVAWSLAVRPRPGGGSWLELDLRVDATDDDAWLDFLPYWKAIGRFSRLIRRMHLRRLGKLLGRAPADAGRVLPGDDILARAAASWTDACTIEAPVREVWPWLVQMGCRRAGWYSLDQLDNGGVPSADHIVPELQHIAVGDVLPATPTGDDGFPVLRVEPERLLVLGSPGLVAPDAAAKDFGMLGTTYAMTWAFVLEPLGDEATRLTVRVRGAFEPNLKNELATPVLGVVHGIMEHEQLRNLKLRAEGRVHGQA